MNTRVIAILAISLAAAPAFAQSNIAPDSKFSWSENCGWMNWRDANSAAQGARFGLTFATGFVWMENVGWVNLGDGTPANGTSYANINGTDFGVNVLADGALGGLAWGENIGWINFSLPTLPVGQRPRVDRTARRLRGYAWGENIGWINLDSPEAGKFVGLLCPADFNQNGSVDFFDYLDFVNAFAADDPSADFNANGIVDFFDYLDFVNAFDVPCE
jgi:hypothetical protein